MLGCERTFATNERDQDRIGCLCSEGITALKNHAWFSGVRPRFLFLEPRQAPALTHTATASSAVAACNLAGGLGYCGCCRRQRGASRHRTIQTEKGAYHCFVCMHVCSPLHLSVRGLCRAWKAACPMPHLFSFLQFRSKQVVCVHMLRAATRFEHPI